MNSAIHRTWHRAQMLLDSLRQVQRGRRIVIGFETMNHPARRIIEMDADENGIALRVADCDSLIERNKDIARACHHSFQLRFTKFAVEATCYVECDGFFGRAVTAIRAAILSPVSRVDRHRVECAARILARRFHIPLASRRGRKQK